MKKISKMQNLSENELNQIEEMHDQSRNELERIAKIRRIKNYEEMSKEELIISLLKSKQSIAQFFINNNSNNSNNNNNNNNNINNNNNNDNDNNSNKNKNKNMHREIAFSQHV